MSLTKDVKIHIKCGKGSLRYSIYSYIYIVKSDNYYSFVDI